MDTQTKGVKSDARDLTIFITVLIGFALAIIFIASIVLALMALPHSLSLESDAAPYVGVLGSGFFLGAFLTCVAGMKWRKIGTIAHRKGQKALAMVTAVIAIVSCAAVVSAFLLRGTLPYIAGIVGFVLAGIACALLLVLWGIAWSKLDARQADEKKALATIAASCALAGVSILGLSFMPTLWRIAFACICVIASLALHYVCMVTFRESEVIGQNSTLSSFRFHMPNLLQPFSACFAVGICIEIVGSGSFPERVPSVLGLCIGLAALIVLPFFMTKGKLVHFSTMQRFICTAMVGLMLLMPFCSSPIARAVVLFLLAATLCAYLTCHYNMLVALSYHHRLLEPLHFMQGLTAPFLGMLCGCCVAGLLFLIPELNEAFVIDVLNAISVFVIVISQAIAPYVAHQQDVYSIPVQEESDNDKKRESRYGKACKAVCERYGLTPREQEVFELLARGRNAGHIGKQLYIATNTVKTHSQRIYRKMEINSQQQLIDMVEERVQENR